MIDIRVRKIAKRTLRIAGRALTGTIARVPRYHIRHMTRDLPGWAGPEVRLGSLEIADRALWIADRAVWIADRALTGTIARVL